MARFTGPGNAANRIPSMANTKPIATTKSDIAATHPQAVVPAIELPWGSRRRCRCPRAGLLARLARRVDEVAEELRVRLQHHARIVVAHAVLISLHRTVEAEE